LRVAVLATFVVLTILGVTTSSIGADPLRQDPSVAVTDTWGEPQAIRSDEYNVFTPLRLSMMATGRLPTVSPLGEKSAVMDRYSTGALVQDIVYWDSTMLKLARYVPEEMVFAAYWWLPSLLILLLTPSWFQMLGASRALGWLAGWLIVVSPANWWWSFLPAQQMAFSLAGSVAMLAAHRRFTQGQVLVPTAQAALAGLLLAGLPTRYTPWALILGGSIFLSSLAALALSPTSIRSRLLALSVTGFVATALVVASIWAGWDGLQTLLSTEYPGSRRSGPEPLPVGVLLGAPFLTELSSGATPVGTNASELSSAPTVAFLGLAFALAYRRTRSLYSHVGELALAVLGLLWLSWCLVSLSGLGTQIPILSFVPATRVGQVVGILGVLSFALAISHHRSRPASLLPYTAAVTCTLATAYAGATLQAETLPTLRTREVLVTSFAVGVCTFLLVRFPLHWAPMVLTGVLALGVVITASPWLRGLGDLRGTPTANHLLQAGQQARSDGTLWVSDSGNFDVAMLSAGLPSLSGVQRSGPVVEKWKALDPAEEYSSGWNRGVSYIDFEWRENAPVEIFGQFDVIFVQADPCDIADRFESLSHVVSTRPLSGDCLSLDTTLQWSGRSNLVYRVTQQ